MSDKLLQITVNRPDQEFPKEIPDFEIETIHVKSNSRTLSKQFILEEPQILTIYDPSIDFYLERILYREVIKEKFNDQVLNDMIDRLIFQIEYYEKAFNKDSKEELCAGEKNE